MAISTDSLETKVSNNLIHRGFVLTGSHSKAFDLATAVAVGVVGEIHSSAQVAVTPHAGGTFKVTGLSADGMFSRIKDSLVGSGFKFGEHSKAGVIPLVISKAVTAEILAKCSVTIPYDGSGTFQIVGLSADALEAVIILGLQGEGFNTERGENNVMAYAVSTGVTDEVNSKAVVSGDFSGGGTFPVL